MAEESGGSQEKTEEATPRRLEKAREEGQIPRSRELSTTFVLLAGVGGLIAYGGDIGQGLLEVMRFNFDLEREAAFDPAAMFKHIRRSLDIVVLALAPIFVLLTVAAVAGPIALGGWLMSAKALSPKYSRLDPISGIKRMFSLHALIELIKAMAKFAVLSSIAVIVMLGLKHELLGLSDETLTSAIAHALDMTVWTLLWVSCGMIVIALVDVPWQLHDHGSKLKMTRQELKDEYKDSEGKPEVKGRIRQLQRQLAQRRMMAAVPEADVVITNPDHFSVALKYNPESDSAPLLLAKGSDRIALKIREIANAHHITIVQAPALARAVYYTTELDQEIPSSLYVAVAQVLAYVFQLRHFRQRKGNRPNPLGEVPIPAEMHYDASGKLKTD